MVTRSSGSGGGAAAAVVDVNSRRTSGRSTLQLCPLGPPRRRRQPGVPGEPGEPGGPAGWTGLVGWSTASHIGHTQPHHADSGAAPSALYTAPGCILAGA